MSTLPRLIWLITQRPNRWHFLKDCNILLYLLSYIKFNQSEKKHKLLTVLILLIFISCKNEITEKGRILTIVSNTEDMNDPEKHFAGNNL